MTREELINVFNNTRNLSKGLFGRTTKEAIKNTHVIVDGFSLIGKNVVKPQRITVIAKGSIAAALGVVSDASKVAVLNFADPYCEGGLVFDGEVTQEEGICRCTNLYETLIKEECWKDYYLVNKNLKDNVFSDRCIYSKGIVIFKDEKYNIVPDTPTVDVISCPAPICCNDIQVFEQRIKCIIGSAYANGVDTLVLGAWGCGVFNNNPEVVAQAFKNVLDEYKLFDRVIFAIKRSKGSSDNNYKIFKKVLMG